MNYEKFCLRFVIYVNPLLSNFMFPLIYSLYFKNITENIDFHFLLSHHTPNLIAPDFIMQKHNNFKTPDYFNRLLGPVKLIFKGCWWFLRRE